MARTFDGVNQFLQTLAPPAQYPLTFSCWFKTSDLVNRGTLMCNSTRADVASTSLHAMWASGDVGGDPVQSQFDGGGTATTTAGYSADTWHHAFCYFSGGWTAVYIDGGNGGSGFHGAGHAAQDRFSIGVTPFNNADNNPFNGSIAEAAVWNTAYGGANLTNMLTMLSAGYSPLYLFQSNLVFYAPLIRNDIDLIGGITMTAYNNPTWANDHPPVRYPTLAELPTLGGSGPGPGPGGISHNALLQSGIFGGKVL